MPLIIIKQEGLPKRGDEDHDHEWHTEHFVNRPEIEFQKCDCGCKKLPEGMVRVFDGSHTEILWPL